jgi:hypothetical protein
MRESAVSTGATVRVDSEILYFQKKGLFSGGEFLTHSRLSRDGAQFADVLVQAESNAFTRGGEKDLARACIHALENYIKKGKEDKHSKHNG